MARATIFDVANSAGVSIKTVSRVVNREPNVRKTTKDRVDKAIAELNYRPDQSARNLASHRAHLIGLIYDDPAEYDLPSSGYIIKMQQGTLRACKTVSYELLIHPCNYRDKNVAADLKALIEQVRPAGLVLAAPLSNMTKIVRAIEETGTPFVRLSPGTKSVKQPSIVTNDREISAEMTRYLISLGHKRIGFITGNRNHKAVANRLPGYKDALAEAGIPFSEKLVLEGDNSIGSGEECAKVFLQRKTPPTAIFAANDDMAAGVIRTAFRMGVDVPGQLSVAGCDDIALAQQIFPTLTTIRQPLSVMAERAALLLIEGKNGKGNGQHYETVEGNLQIRDSTGPVPA